MSLVLPPEDISAALQKLDSAWQVIDQKKIARTFKFLDFTKAMRFVNRVAAIAETHDHHPDIDIRYNMVTITFWTHSAGGLTEKDFTTAHDVEKIL